MAERENAPSGLSDAQKRKAVAKVMSGSASMTEVAEELGVSGQAIGGWIRDPKQRFGGDPEWRARTGSPPDVPKRPRFSDAIRRKAVAMVLGGMSQREVADKLDVERTSIGDWLRNPEYGGSPHFNARPDLPRANGTSEYLVDRTQPEEHPPIPTIPLPMVAKDSRPHSTQRRARGRTLTIKCGHCKGEHEICIAWLMELEGVRQ